MRTKMVEGVSQNGVLYLKAMVCRFDPDDWRYRSRLAQQYNGMNISLLAQEGWTKEHFVILDLSIPGNGHIFKMGGNAAWDCDHSGAAF